jgi:AmmeMemoRadiSam system protein B
MKIKYKGSNLLYALKKKEEEDEHSLEMHIPYIKKIFKDQDIKILPFMVG